MKKTLLSLALVALAAFVAADTMAPVPSTLNVMRGQYAGIRSIHMRAAGPVTIGNVTGTVVYKYWAQGQNYRIAVISDPALGLADDYVYAFDGTHRYFHDKTIDVLSTQLGDSPHVVTAIPNPILLPLQALESTGCADCPLTLAALNNDATWANSVTAAGAYATDGDSARLDIGSVQTVVTAGKITAIHYVENGARVGSAIFSNHQTFPGGVVLPTSIVLRADGMTANFTVTTLEVNGTIDPAVFSMCPDDARSAWDDEAQTFTKSAGRALSGISCQQ